MRPLRRERHPSVHPLLYQRVPVQVASEGDTHEGGNLPVDYVAHWGRSTGGEYVQTMVRMRMSRSRRSQKNDNAGVEQKNGTPVRQMVGYHRYDPARPLALLNQI